MLGMAILLGFHFIGLILHNMAHVPLPANVIGLILFTAALFLKVIKLEWVEESAQFLVRHLMLFFAPVIVGTIAFASILGQYWLATLFSLVLSTLIVLWVSGWVTTVMLKKGLTDESE